MDRYLVHGDEYKALRDAVGKAMLKCKAPGLGAALTVGWLAASLAASALVTSKDAGVVDDAECRQAYAHGLHGALASRGELVAGTVEQQQLSWLTHLLHLAAPAKAISQSCFVCLCALPR